MRPLICNFSTTFQFFLTDLIHSLPPPLLYPPNSCEHHLTLFYCLPPLPSGQHIAYTHRLLHECGSLCAYACVCVLWGSSSGSLTQKDGSSKGFGTIAFAWIQNLLRTQRGRVISGRVYATVIVSIMLSSDWPSRMSDLSCFTDLIRETRKLLTMCSLHTVWLLVGVFLNHTFIVSRSSDIELAADINCSGLIWTETYSRWWTLYSYLDFSPDIKCDVTMRT